MPEPRHWHLERALLPEGIREGVRVTVDEQGRIVELGKASRGAMLAGLGLPGLVNAHLHLELSALRGRVPGGEGLYPWVGAMMGQRRALPEEAAEAGIRVAIAELEASGTVAVADISNSLAPLEALAASSLQGVLHHERLGFDADGSLPEAPSPRGGFVVRPSPHAPYSTSAALVRACVAAEGPPATIHLDEDPAERALLQEGSGPWRDMLEALGRDLSTWSPPGCSPVAWLAELGVLGPRLGLVHLVGARPEDLDRVAEAGCTVVLCPRSNLHIGGRLPDLRGLVERGIPLALGTDSLASCPDLDLLAEVAVLREACPELPEETWLYAATAGGARLLERPALGALTVGAAPGLLLLAPHRRTLLEAAPC